MIEVDRVVSTEEKAEDLALEPTVRPARLRDYIGQDRVREQMDIWLSAARKRGKALDHVLLFGPPGLGTGGYSRSGFQAGKEFRAVYR